MPHDLTKLDQVTAKARTYRPTFFDSKLTGSGKTAGILCEAANPKYADPQAYTTNEHLTCRKRKYTNGQIDVSLTPLFLLSPEAWDEIVEWTMPDRKSLALVGSRTTTGGVWEVWLDMRVHSIHRTESDPNFSGKKTKTITVCYQTFVYVMPKGATRARQISSTNRCLVAPAGLGTFMTDFSCTPKNALQRRLSQLSNEGFNIAPNAAGNFIDAYSLFDGACAQSRLWQTDIDEVVREYLMDVTTHSNLNRHVLSDMMRRLEAYKVPLEVYHRIFAHMTNALSPDLVHALCRENMSLLLADTLNDLDNDKPQITHLPPEDPKNPVHIAPFLDKKRNRMITYSAEQCRAIETREPLALVQAGAGSGKSSVILARLRYMQQLGIHLPDVMVLSFTNAAADNIRDQNNGVKSMTIASMIHQIYTTNFPQHGLSSIETLRNTIDIYRKDDPFAQQFRRHLWSVGKNDRGAMTQLNAFIEDNYDQVMALLDAIGQTTLELEIIICYQKVEQLVEPPDIRSRYLIMDEVQDNSVFEFIYVLKYVAKNKESLFIVGDSAQTLYEFRASDPRALNVLEGSGTFACYKLQTNYRSNQDVLDFANILLRNIEANQYAKIQLHANSLAATTVQSFSEHVQLHYERYRYMPKNKDNDPTLRKLIQDRMVPYVEGCLARGEGIGLLAHSRAQVNCMYNVLEDHFRRTQRNVTMARLLPERSSGSTVLSQFVRYYWDQAKFLPTGNLAASISNVVVLHANELLPRVPDHNTRIAMCRRICNQWMSKEGYQVNNWHQQYLAGIIPIDKLFENTQMCLIQHEMRMNAAALSLRSQRNREEKDSQQVKNAQIKFSTIHSAKGLQFPNVGLLYKASNQLIDEPDKRMYYVALTRAEQTEFILAYGTTPNPVMQASYQGYVQELARREAQAAMPTD